nr:phage tail tube protein [uncultured Oscillibacter sp.]
MKSNAVGTQLLVNGKPVGGLTSINGIEVSAEAIDVTDLANKDGYREKLPGFKDGGEVGASGFMDGDNEGQDECYALLESGDVVDCSIVFPAKIGKTWKFKAGITKFSTSAEVENAVTFEISLAVSGKPTLTATTASAG